MAFIIVGYILMDSYRLIAKRFVAAANFLEVLKVFSTVDVSESVCHSGCDLVITH
jgi:hypothetical protein